MWCLGVSKNTFKIKHLQVAIILNMRLGVRMLVNWHIGFLELISLEHLLSLKVALISTLFFPSLFLGDQVIFGFPLTVHL